MLPKYIRDAYPGFIKTTKVMTHAKYLNDEYAVAKIRVKENLISQISDKVNASLDKTCACNQFPSFFLSVG